MVDLTRDPTPLIELTSEEIRERLYTKKEELGNLAGIPVKLVHINKCPVLAPAATLTPERADELGINREQCRKSLDLLRAHPEVREKLVEVFNQEFAGSNDERSRYPALRRFLRSRRQVHHGSGARHPGGSAGGAGVCLHVIPVCRRCCSATAPATGPTP